MLAVIILVVLLLVLAVGGLVLWTRMAATGARTVGEPLAEPQRLFRGGVMSRYVLTSGSMVRFETFDWGIRIRGSALSRWLVPTWEARYDELESAKLIALPHSRITVWLRLRGTTPGDSNAIGFLSERSGAILDLLQGKGVPVDRSVTQVKRVAELYSRGT